VSRIGVPDGGFNPSIAKYGKDILVAWRTDHRRRGGPRSSISIGVLNSNMSVSRTTRLLDMAEDPRLFLFGNRIGVAYTYSPDCKMESLRQGYAFLDSDFRIVENNIVSYGNPPQKNWGFFQYAGRLHCVYSIDPHVVLEVCDGLVKREYRTLENWLRWDYGSVHGSTSPTEYNGSFLSVFRSFVRKRRFGSARLHRKVRFYYSGAYTFSAEPPFCPLSYSGDPILRPSSVETRVRIASGIVVGEKLTVSYGLMDRESEVIEMDIPSVLAAKKSFLRPN
jgi:predicted GH43/DUF377 family glycosyl hydrolase